MHSHRLINEQFLRSRLLTIGGKGAPGQPCSNDPYCAYWFTLAAADLGQRGALVYLPLTG